MLENNGFFGKQWVFGGKCFFKAMFLHDFTFPFHQFNFTHDLF